jgi:glycosyltransferase involved in cell wall biosynthesis
VKSSSTIALLIPAYNAASYLPRLLQSAIRQSEPFDEIWVYDDCSTDDTAAVARRFGTRVVRGDVNRGCSHGKNALAAMTSAEWLHFHDADDELLPNFVSLARRWANDGRFDVILFPFEERNDDTGAHMAFNRFDPTDVARDARSYAIRTQINAICGLYRRSAFLRAGGYDEDPLVLYNEDVAMHVQLAFAGLSFAAETEISIINHRRLTSMSAVNRLKCLQAHYHVMRKAVEREGASQYASQIADKLWNAVGGLASQQDWSAADEAARLAVRIAGLSTLPRGTVFRTMCRISPFAALRLREFAIRAFKPGFREGYPGWRSPVSIV